MKTSPATFIRQVRQEVGKVTWPTRKETMVSTIMVLIMVTISAVFFLAVDSLIAVAIKKILGIGA